MTLVWMVGSLICMCSLENDVKSMYGAIFVVACQHSGSVVAAVWEKLKLFDSLRLLDPKPVVCLDAVCTSCIVCFVVSYFCVYCLSGEC